jgi:uncharacterized protein (TIGR02246 family)
MRTTAILAAASIAALVATIANVPAASAQQSRADDEKAVRLEVGAFTKAANAHDAKALAALFAPEGEIVNEEGHALQGREAIEKTFAALFEANPNLQINISIQSIRFVSPAVAIEDGTSTTTHRSGPGAEHNRYTVVRVKQDGRWQIASARDLPDEEAEAGDELEQLGWMVGQWVNESPEALVVTSYRWDDQRHSILGEFKVQVGGRPAMTGTQRISWDPAAKKLHSWVFDSEGGFGEGLWTRNGNQWVVKVAGTRRDGSAASATRIITQVTKDRMTWRSRDRVAGNEVLPEAAEIVIVRRPPPPASQAPGAKGQ